MNDISIKPVKLRHIPRLKRQFEHAARTSFSYLPESDMNQVIADNNLRQLYKAWLLPRRILLGAWTAQGELVGYVIGSVVNSDAQLYWLYVAPETRGKNVGLRLLTRMCRESSRRGARRLALSTHDHRAYYERQGFKHRARRTMHGVPMDIMELQIHGG